jgi:hypothetical protein
MWKGGVGQTRRHRKSMLVGTAHTLTCVGEGKSSRAVQWETNVQSLLIQ